MWISSGITWNTTRNYSHIVFIRSSCYDHTFDIQTIFLHFHMISTHLSICKTHVILYSIIFNKYVMGRLFFVKKKTAEAWGERITKVNISNQIRLFLFFNCTTSATWLTAWHSKDYLLPSYRMINLPKSYQVMNYVGITLSLRHTQVNGPNPNNNDGPNCLQY